MTHLNFAVWSQHLAPAPQRPQTLRRPGLSCPEDGSLSKGEPWKMGKHCPHLHSRQQVLPAPACTVLFPNTASRPGRSLQPLLLPWPRPLCPHEVSHAPTRPHLHTPQSLLMLSSQDGEQGPCLPSDEPRGTARGKDVQAESGGTTPLCSEAHGPSRALMLCWKSLQAGARGLVRGFGSLPR